MKFTHFIPRSDKKMRKIVQSLRPTINTKKIAFNSLGDIRDEIGPLVKSELGFELEIDVLHPNCVPKSEAVDGKDIIIANTVIRKVDCEKKFKEENSQDDFEVSIAIWVKYFYIYKPNTPDKFEYKLTYLMYKVCICIFYRMTFLVILV